MKTGKMEIIKAILAVATAAGYELDVELSDRVTLHLARPSLVTHALMATGRTPRGSIAYPLEGKSLTVREWAQKLGVSTQTIRNRMKKHGTPYSTAHKADRKVSALELAALAGGKK